MTGQELNPATNNRLTWIFGSRMRTAAFYTFSALLLVVVTFVVAFLMFNPRSTPQVETTASGQVLAWEIAELVQTSGASQQTSGIYAPGRGIFLYTLLANGQNKSQISWAAAQLTPLAGRFSGLAQNELLYWYISDADSGSQTLITVPFGRIDDVAYYDSYQAPNHSVTAYTPETAVAPAPETLTEPEPVMETAVIDIPETETVIAPDIQNVTAVFDVNAEGWTPMSGDWIAENGVRFFHGSDGNNQQVWYPSTVLNRFGCAGCQL